MPVLLALGQTVLAQSEFHRVLDSKRYHLGTAGLAEWEEFEGTTPHGRQLDLGFNAEANEAEQTLFIRQRDVKQTWDVVLNGRKLGRLELTETPAVAAFRVPPKVLKPGANLLSVIPPKAVDDIVVGEFVLDNRPAQSALRESTLEVKVTDAASQAGLPCRLTIVDREGAYVSFSAETNQPVAVRPGVAYTQAGTALLQLRAGDYTVYAGRGFEYSVTTQHVSLARGERKQLNMAIAREVPTEGWAAADTHIHTLTYSGHGDANVDERMLTIAGEGIELAIATDHNHHTDYSEAALRTRLQSRFTRVIGNEVTTRAGHFNAFPISPGSAVADFKTSDWSVLLRNIRATRVQVITLNHPRDLHSNFIPFASTNLNPVTGESLQGREYGFDAVEVITSGALQSDPMLLFRDWFALLNHGHRVSAVASSDTHDVSRFILGQGRTYVACKDQSPGSIEVNEACRSFREGRTLVSMGLLVQMVVDGTGRVGDVVKPLGAEIEVQVSVHGPSWIQADQVELFSNGVKIREAAIAPANSVEKAKITWRIPRPAADAHLVAVASGPGVTAPFWEIPRPYQPSSKRHVPRVIGATNPVWVDADGDGKFMSARATAEKLIRDHGTNAARLLPALRAQDEAVAAQAASLCRAAGVDIRSEEFKGYLKAAAPAVQRGFAAYLDTVP